MSRRRRLPLSVILAAGLFILLAVLSVVQYRWLDEFSRAEGLRMQEDLSRSADRFSEEFDQRITRVFRFFGTDGSPRNPVRESLGRRCVEWREGSFEKALVSAVFLVTPKPDPFEFDAYGNAAEPRNRTGPSFDPRPPPRRGERGMNLEIWDEARRTFVSVEWPAGLDRFRDQVEHRGGGERPVTPVISYGSQTFLVIPEGSVEPGGPPEGPAFALIQLDLGYVRDKVIPQLAAEVFGTSPEGTHVSVIDRDGQRLWASSSMKGERSSEAGGDVMRPIFMIRPGGTGPFRRLLPRPEPLTEGGSAGRDRGGLGWRLVVSHPSGSVGEAVARLRRRNLAIAGGIFFLLATSVGLVVSSAQRAERLAWQQVEFIAGVSHELRTPLTAIRSAGENLADGVITSDEAVRRYGSMIAGHGRRLSTIVQQVLDYAGGQARSEPSDQSLSVQELVKGAIEDCAEAIRVKGVTVETRIPSDLPAIKGDAAALRRALRNVIENAVKYGGGEAWLRVAGVKEQRSGKQFVRLTVEDRGMGFDDSEASVLFEPFYRSRRVVASPIPGTGLGLTIVKRIIDDHHGRVRISSRNGEPGTIVTLSLPADSARQGRVS